MIGLRIGYCKVHLVFVLASEHDDWGGADYLLEVTQALAIAGRNTLALDWLDDYLSGSGVYSTLIVIKELPAFSRLVGGTGIFRPR
jgi:hypothetical protein